MDASNGKTQQWSKYNVFCTLALPSLCVEASRAILLRLGMEGMPEDEGVYGYFCAQSSR
jgi:hypothetical protein